MFWYWLIVETNYTIEQFILDVTFAEQVAVRAAFERWVRDRDPNRRALSRRRSNPPNPKAGVNRPIRRS